MCRIEVRGLAHSLMASVDRKLALTRPAQQRLAGASAFWSTGKKEIFKGVVGQVVGSSGITAPAQ